VGQNSHLSEVKNLLDRKILSEGGAGKRGEKKISTPKKKRKEEKTSPKEEKAFQKRAQDRRRGHYLSTTIRIFQRNRLSGGSHSKFTREDRESL